MYGKLFSSMFSGSLYGHWQAIVTFQQMIILADKDGTIEMTPAALAAFTSIPLDIITAGISVLESPDANIRTPGEDGRRITRINPDRPWGWHITNYAHYRAIRTAEDRREYHKNYWHNRKKGTQPDSTSTQPNQPIAGAYAEAKALKTTTARSHFVSPTIDEIRTYCRERQNSVDPQSFFDHYESNGWKVGRNAMKDWKAAVRTWEKNQRKHNGKDQRIDNSAPARVQRAIDKRAEERKHRDKEIDGSAH